MPEQLFYINSTIKPKKCFTMYASQLQGIQVYLMFSAAQQVL